MKSFFLKAQNWKVFLLIFIPFLLGIVALLWTYIFFVLYPEERSTTLLYFILSTVFLFGLSMSIKGFWQWSVVFQLNKKLEDKNRFNLKRYNQLSVIESVNFVLLLLLGYWIYKALISDVTFPFLEIILLVPIIILQQLIKVYSITIAAKVLKTNEVNRKVELSECISELFMFYFIMVGLWMIQPKVNEVYEAKMN